MDQWPPALKDFVNTTFAQCTPANRSKVETELRAAIYKAYTNGTLHQVDWKLYQLESLKSHAFKRKKYNDLPVSSQAGSSAAVDARESMMRHKRQRRFEDALSIPQPANTKLVARLGIGTLGSPEPEASFNPDVVDWDKHTIVGTSMKLEKPYLRLTSLPDPASIRPIPVLRQTLDMLKDKWKTEANYAYICDQFKSMRQDLTVQRIKNDFTVAVYEIHARIALEKGDLGEYNQCQSMLKSLYLLGLKGHPLEFAAYRILYLLHTRNRSELNAMLSALTETERADPGIRHALEVRRAMATSNYHRLFKRFQDAPKMGAYLIDHFLERERLAALVTVSKAYKGLELGFLTQELALNDTDQLDRLLFSCNAAFYLPSLTITVSQDSFQNQLDCRRAHPHLIAALPDFTKVDIKGQI